MTETRPICVMRVIARLNVGGPAIHVILLTEHLRPPEFESTLVCGFIGPQEGDMAYLAEERGVSPLYISQLGRELSPLRDILTLFKLWRLMRRLRPDVVHTHTAKAGFVGRWAAWLARVPVRVHTFHGHVFHGYFSPAKEKLFLVLERLTARLSDKLITISPGLKDELVNTYRIAPAEKFEVVPLGLDLDTFAQTPRHQGVFRASFNIPPDVPLVGIVGRFVPIKNHALFLDMAQRVRQHVPDAHFVLVGDGECRAEIEANGDRLGLRDCTIFTGWQTNLAPVYSDMDVLVISSKNEGTPVSVIEALAAGVPVVSTAVGGVPDLLCQGDWGRLVPPDDSAALSEAVIDTLAHPPQSEKFRAPVVAQYGIDRLTENLAGLYRRLLAAKSNHSDSWRRVAVGFSLMVFLCAIYFLTFNGTASSRDEWFLMDATESWARRENLKVNYEYDAYPPRTLETAAPRPIDSEPLQPMLASILFRIGQAAPDIGLVHTVWLFNVLITTLTAGLLYAYVLSLRYSVKVALLAALIFGLATIAWPYSRTFFREPLFTLLALLSIVMMARLRQRPDLKGTIFALIVFGLAFVGALLSKEAALLIMPAVMVEAFPARLGHFRLSRRVALTLFGLALLVGVVILIILNGAQLAGVTERFDLAHRFEYARAHLSGISTPVRGYLFSPARSIWVFSPVLLLGFVGLIQLVKQRRWRLFFLPLSMLVSFVVGYAFFRGVELWYGGTGWGARYMVPVTPFLVLWLLPVIESILRKGASWWKRAAVTLIVLLSVAVQLLPILVPINRYDEYLAAQNPVVIPWNEGAWAWRWSPLWVSLRFVGDQPAAVAWKSAVGDAWLLPVASLLLAVVALAALAGWSRRKEASPHWALISSAALSGLAVFTFGLGLYAIRHDPRYYGDFKPAQDLLARLEPKVQPDDVIVLNDFTYKYFFTNYYKKTQPVIYTLPQSPGERNSPEQPPQVELVNPENLILFSNTLALAYFAERHERLWLVINSSSFIPWSVRPVEHYLARHYFPVSEVKGSDVARAVLFDMTPAPPPTASAWPENRTDAVFNKELELIGFDVPGGTVRQAGDIFPVSLLWKAAGTIPQDYTVALFLIDPRSGAVLAQRDSMPVNNFDPTSFWRSGSLHRDNHGLLIPDAAQPGEYELWLVLYWWQSPGERLAVTDASGQEIGDHLVLGKVTIQP